MKSKKSGSPLVAIASALVFLVAGNPVAGHNGATGIIASIEKAPVAADGNVSGKPFNYVITLDGSLDPQVLGRGIAAGGIIKIYLPPEFDLSNIDPAQNLRGGEHSVQDVAQKRGVRYLVQGKSASQSARSV